MRSIAWVMVALLGLAPAARAQVAVAASETLRATLANGLRVVIVRDRLAPVASIALNYLAGSNDAPEGFPGTAHALEHMMFRGSPGLDRDQLSELGALLGGNNNANTSETNTQYTTTVPVGDLPIALRIDAARMRALNLTEADWTQERGAIEQEVSRDLSSPFYRAIAQVQSILFAGTPYEHDALGTRPSFDQTDAALLRRFYERWYAPNNAVLVITGDVDPAQALAEVHAAFDDIPARDVPAHPAFTLSPVPARDIALPTNFSIGLVAIAYRMPGLADRDFAAADILSDVLGSERGALYGLVPAGRVLLAQFDYQPKADVGVGLALAGFPAGGDAAPALADLRRVIAAAAAGDIPVELVEAAKRQEIARLAFGTNSIDGLASAWSRALVSRRSDSPDELVQAYAAVTLDDVRRLAATLLDPAHAVTAVLTPDNSGKPTPGRGFGGGESLSSPPDHPVVLPDWARAALAAAPVVESTPPDVSVLPNGLRLIVQPEHVSRTVSVFGRIRQRAELQEPAGQEGVAALTGELFDAGTEAHDRLAFRAAVDDIAAEIDAGPRFSLKVPTDAFAAGMRLLAENELRPAFPDDAFAVAREQLAQRTAGALRSPETLFGRAVTRALVPHDDPTLRQATPETIRALKPADVRAFYAGAWRPDLTTIVIVGDVTPEQARQVVTATFGEWRAEGEPPAVDLPPVVPNLTSQTQVPDPSSLQDTVSLAETIGLPIASPDRYTLLLGNAILGSGFSSRLYRDLRVRTGYVYSVDSELDVSRTRASYAIEFGADPGDVGRARDLAVRDLREMQTNPVSETELARARAEVMRRFPMQRSSVQGIAGVYLRLADLGLPLDAPRIAAKRYGEITAEEIRAAFAKWVRVDDLAMVVRGPAPGP